MKTKLTLIAVAAFAVWAFAEKPTRGNLQERVEALEQIVEAQQAQMAQQEQELDKLIPLGQVIDIGQFVGVEIHTTLSVHGQYFGMMVNCAIFALNQ